MTDSWIASIFFVIAFSAMLSGIYLVQKKEEKISGVVWAPISIVLAICVNGFLAAIINFVHIPVNIVSMGGLDLLLAAVFWWLILGKKRRQVYDIPIQELVIMLVLVGIAIGYGIFHFGTELTAAFQAVDAPRHYTLSMNIVTSQKIDSSMFMSDLYGALFIEIFSVFFKPDFYYKIFVLSEMVNLVLTAACFFALVAKFCNSKFMNVMTGIFSLFFLFGYPVHNLQFGFVYWGMGVTVLTCILYFLEIWIQEENKWLYSVILAILNFALFELYSLFVPPVYLGSFLFLVSHKQIRKRLLEKKILLNLIIMYLPAIIVGLLYSYATIAYTGITAGTSSDSGGTSDIAPIAREGGIYKSFYSDFIVLLPFSLMVWWKSLREKKMAADCAVFICMVLFMAVLLFGGTQGKVSSYYYCKNNYVIWLLVFASAIRAIYHLWEEKNGHILVPYFITWGLVFLLFFGKIEEKIANKNSQFNFGTAKSYYSIYEWNRYWESLSQYDDGKMNLFLWVKNNLTKQGQKVAISSDSALDEEWYRVMTKSNFINYNGDWETYVSQVESKARYVCVMYNNFYYHHQNHFKDYTKIYECDWGFVAEIKSS